MPDEVSQPESNPPTQQNLPVNPPTNPTKLKKVGLFRCDDQTIIKIMQMIAEDFDVDAIVGCGGISKSALPIIRHIAALVIDNPEAASAAKAISETVARLKSDSEFMKKLKSKDTKEPYADWK